MRAVLIGLLVFGCTFSGSLAGLYLRKILPDHHLSSDSKDVIKLSIGLIATMTALILGLVTASVKSSFDEINVVVKRTSAEVLTLDRTLARYGPETNDLRIHFRGILAQRIEIIWPQSPSNSKALDILSGNREAEHFVDELRQLAPQTEEQRFLKAHALDIAENLLGARWTVISSSATSVPIHFNSHFLADNYFSIFWFVCTKECNRNCSPVRLCPFSWSRDVSSPGNGWTI